MAGRILKFADDTKVYGRVGSRQERERMQADLTRLFEWAEKWQIVFNADKCAVMHIGGKNVKESYTLGGKVLSEVVEERDLGVIVQNDLKVDKQCRRAANEGNKMLGMIRRNFECKDKVVVIPFYK